MDDGRTKSKSAKTVWGYILLLPLPIWLLAYLVCFQPGLGLLVSPSDYQGGWAYIVIVIWFPIAAVLFIASLIGALMTALSWRTTRDWGLAILSAIPILVIAGVGMHFGPDYLRGRQAEARAAVMTAAYSPDGNNILTAKATDRPRFPATIAAIPAATVPPPQATATAQAAGSLRQTASSWPIVMSDPFDGNGNGWETGGLQWRATFKASNSIANGKFHWSVEAIASPALDSELPIAEIPADFAASVEGREISGTPNGRYGLIFRWGQENAYYLFDVADDGSFKVSLASNEKPGEALVSGTSAAIKPGAANRLTVIGQGSHFTFFVNDRYVAELEDTSLSAGAIGLAVELLSEGNRAVFEFDNLEIRAPQ